MRRSSKYSTSSRRFVARSNTRRTRFPARSKARRRASFRRSGRRTIRSRRRSGRRAFRRRSRSRRRRRMSSRRWRRRRSDFSPVCLAIIVSSNLSRSFKNLGRRSLRSQFYYIASIIYIRTSTYKLLVSKLSIFDMRIIIPYQMIKITINCSICLKINVLYS